MGCKFAWLVVLLLTIPAPALTGFRLPNLQFTRSLPNSTTMGGARVPGLASSVDLSELLPGSPPSAAAYHVASYQFAPGSSGGGFYVGAFASNSLDRSNVPNSGIRGTIQVVSQQVSGCLSYWVDDDSAANIWGQVGYYICNGSTPVAFYQVWNLNTYAVLASGTSLVSQGYHSFSMYSVNGSDTWVYALDANVIGAYNMSAETSSSTYGVGADAEEGYVSSAYQPVQKVELSAVQTYSAAVWSPVLLTYEPWACGTSGMSCWGIQGNLQNSSIPLGGYVTGGTTPLVSGGALLWNGSPTTSSVAVNPQASDTSVSCTSRYLVVGLSGAVKCTARVTGQPPTGTVAWSQSGAGSVTFTSNTCALREGACAVTMTGASAGPVVVRAVYGGNSNNSGSSNVAKLTVSKATPVLFVSCRSSSVTVGSSTSCTATLKGYAGSVAGEKITWSKIAGAGGVSFASTRCALSSKGTCLVKVEGVKSRSVAAPSTKGATTGSVVVQASYGGNPGNMASSRTTRLTVTKVTPALSVSCTSTSGAIGSFVTCTATLKGYAGSVAGEKVTWSRTGGTGGVAFSSYTCTLSSKGTCYVTVTGTKAGFATIEALYAGDSNNVRNSRTSLLKIT